ncbi:MAG: peptide deformylase [Parachlamydiaceae bacterium]
MKLPLAYYGAPILRKKCKRVDKINDELRQLIHDMEETMMSLDGIGIAAPQVHHDLALFLVRVPKETESGEPEEEQTMVFINPKILEHSEEHWFRGEGCLSIPKVYGTVERPLRIKVEATDLNGSQFVHEYSDLEARAIMHENDHINGVLFIDRVQGKERQELDSALRAIKKKYAK